MKESKGNNRRNIIAILSIFMMIVVVIGATLSMIHETPVYGNNKPIDFQLFRENLGYNFEVGKVFKIDKYVNNDVTNFSYYFIDANGETVDIITTRYFDSDGNEVAMYDALDADNNLKAGYIKKDYLNNIGTYTIIVEFDNDSFERTINIKDTKAPILALKDKLEITEGDSYEIKDFIKSCSDSSGVDCILKYVDKDDNEIEFNETKPGKYAIKIIASDETGNKSKSQETELIVSKVKTNNSTSSNKKGTIGSSKEETSTNKNEISTNNPIAKKALSYVGQSGIRCYELVEGAVNAVNKSFYSYYDYYYPYYGGNKKVYYTREKKNVDYIFSNHTHSYDTTITRYKGDSTTGEKVNVTVTFYINNNILQDVKTTGCNWISNNQCPSGYTDAIGKEFYVLMKSSTITEDSIKFNATKVSLNKIQPGDILVYDDGGNGIGHIAVYIGNEKAVHGGWGEKLDVVIATMYPSSASTPKVYRVNY